MWIYLYISIHFGTVKLCWLYSYAFNDSHPNVLTKVMEVVLCLCNSSSLLNSWIRKPRKLNFFFLPKKLYHISYLILNLCFRNPLFNVVPPIQNQNRSLSINLLYQGFSQDAHFSFHHRSLLYTFVSMFHDCYNAKKSMCCTLYIEKMSYLFKIS